MFCYKGGSNRNAIVYYNHATSGVANVVCEGQGIWHAYCAMTPLVSNLFAGPGLQTNAPGFVNATAGDCRLQAASPCRDAGTNLPWMSGALDLDGHPRIIGARTDMGCYEYVPEPGGLGVLGLVTMYTVVCWTRRHQTSLPW